jgi:LCP family protein required for cell wall assembly
VALALAGLLGAAVSLGAMQGMRVLTAIGQSINTIPVPGTDHYDGSFDQPRNVLVLGSDTRAGLSKEQQAAFGSEETVSGERSDTIILLHLDPRREEAVMIHFPRDLLVEIPGYGEEKINAAYELGGPGLAVRTVKEFTGIPVHNYVEVNLAGFQQLVDALGGVEVCVDRPLFDELAGLDIPKAGCYTFDGATALAFVRARHIEGDLIPDFSRITRQQQFIRAMMNKLISLGSFLKPELIRTAASSVKVDEGITTADFLYLGTKLRQLAQEDPSGASSLDLRVVPSTTETIDGVSYVIALEPQTTQLFRALRKGQPLGDVGLAPINTSLSPGVITVQALDAGSPVETQEATDLLRQAGFIVLEPGTAPPDSEKSEILFRPDAADMAPVVGGYFPGLPTREVEPEVLGEAQVAVVVGDDYRAVIS